MRSSMVLAASLALGFSALAQEEDLRFEVASVRPAAPKRFPIFQLEGGPGSRDPERISYTNGTLRYLFILAYGVQDYQVSGPDWLKSERYDIVAKLPPRATKEQFQAMLRRLLAERFNVSLHHEARSMSVYNLTVAENGPRLREAEAALDEQPRSSPGPIPQDKNGFLQIPSGRPGMVFSQGDGIIRYTARMQSLSDITAFLTREIGRPVVNKTGLMGSFDFTLGFDHAAASTANPGLISARIDEPGGGPSLQKAVHDQLGLTLISAKELIDVLVIDRVDKVPTPN